MFCGRLVVPGASLPIRGSGILSAACETAADGRGWFYILCILKIIPTFDIPDEYVRTWSCMRFDPMSDEIRYTCIHKV